MKESTRTYIILFSLLGIAYLGGLFLQIMDVDAAQYASMSLQMLKSKVFLQLYDNGPYLDKPPLLFWLSSLSFGLFGISDFTYRLPSFLATILAVYSTWKLAKLWYPGSVAIWSALMLAGCQAFFLFNHDVKTDNLLCAFSIFAIWQLSAYTRTQKPHHFIAAFAGIAFAMLAKGPIGFVLPVVAIGADLLLKRNWKMIFNLRWLLGIPIILIILSPFLIGLYQEWGMYGIRFFFWTQSFGRITGESEWANGSGRFFFVHTFLWAFLPWTICSLVAFFMSSRELVTSRFKLTETQEGFSITGFILIFFALSLSRYKLPHYIFILMPLASIFTARWLYELITLGEKPLKWLWRIQTGVFILLGVAILSLLWLVFQPIAYIWVVVVAVLTVASIIMALRGTTVFNKIIAPGIICIVAINIGLNFDFYPHLLKYQCTNTVGKIITENKVPEGHFFCYGNHNSHSLRFYAQRDVKSLYSRQSIDSAAKSDVWVYTDRAGYNDLSGSYTFLNPYREYNLRKFTIQKLNIKFLNPATRQGTLENMYLLHLGAKTNTTN